MGMRFGLNASVLEQIQAVLKSFPEVDAAILYGSRAKGDFKPGSDIDIALQGESLNLKILNAIAGRLDDLLLPYTFDLTLLHRITHTDLLEHIQRVGIALL